MVFSGGLCPVRDREMGGSMARIRRTAGREFSQASRKTAWLIAVYIRLSREDGNDESLSVTNQKKIIGEYLETFFEGEFMLVDYYIDDGLTGTDYDRPDFQRMIHDMEAGKVNCIICKNLSRMFRNYSDQGYFLEKVFPMHKVRFITVSDPKVDSYLHPETLQGLEIPINGLMNDRFAAKTSLDVRATFATKRRKGEFIGAFAPYGYKKNPENKNALMIDEEAAEVVRNIYRWFVYEGMSKNGIARRLNDLGIPSPAAYKKSKGLNFCCPQRGNNDGLWSPGSVTAVLRNKMYLGIMVQGKQTVISYKVHERQIVPEEDWYMVPDTHEPIIEAELFKKAADLQTRDTRTGPSGKRLYILSGFIRCGDCRKAMTRQKTKNIVYYYCRTFREKSKKACAKHTIREETVIKAVLAAIQLQISLVGSIDEVVEKICKSPALVNESTGLAAMLRLRQKEWEKVIGIADGLYGDWKSGELSKEEYIRLKQKYSSQADQLEIIIQNIQAECQAMEKEGAKSDPYLDYFLKHKNIKELNSGILVSLVKNIYIYRSGEISIEFNFADRHRGVGGGGA